MRFARPPQANAAALLPRQVRPHLLQPRERVFELRELDLQPRLDRLRPGGEDVENQFATVEHLDPERLLQVARLGRREVVVEDHHVGVGRLDEFGEFPELARADVRGELNVLPLLGEFRDDGGAGGLGEPADLVARVVAEPRPVRQRHADQNRLFAGDRELVPLGVECPTDVVSPASGGGSRGAGAE
jgi:hypothetical protein